MKNYEIEVDYFADHDDWCAYFVYAEHDNGTPFTDEELENASYDDKNQELLYEYAFSSKVAGADFL